MPRARIHTRVCKSGLHVSNFDTARVYSWQMDSSRALSFSSSSSSMFHFPSKSSEAPSLPYLHLLEPLKPVDLLVITIFHIRGKPFLISIAPTKLSVHRCIGSGSAPRLPAYLLISSCCSSRYRLAPKAREHRAHPHCDKTMERRPSYTRTTSLEPRKYQPEDPARAQVKRAHDAAAA